MPHASVNGKWSAWLDWLVALALFAAAIPVAFLRLDAQSLWLDEGTTQAYVTSTYLGALLFDLVRPSQGYPLYHVLLKLVVRTLGDSEWALRAPSALAASLTVPSLYALGTELRGRTTGLAAAALLVLAPWGLGLAQEAKVYSLALLVVVVLSWLLARALRLGARGHWTLVFVVALVAPFVHRLLILSLLGCFAAWAVVQPRSRRWPALMAAVVLSGIAVGAIIGSLRYNSATAQYPDYGPLAALQVTAAQFSLAQFAGSVPWRWFVPFAVMAFLGLIRCALDLRPGNSDTRARRGTILLLVLGGVPLVLFLLVLSRERFYETRYLVGVYPFFLLLLGWSVALPQAWRSVSVRRMVALALPVAGLVAVVGALVAEHRALYQSGRGIFSGAALREDYRKAVTRLAEHVHPDDLVIVYPDTILPLYNYYARRVASFPLPAALSYPQLGRAEGFDRRELDVLIKADLQQAKRAWLLIAPDHARLADPPIAEGDDLGLVGLAFQYGDQNGRIQCGEQPYAGFAGVRLYCNNMPDMGGMVPEPAVPLEATFADQLRLRGYTVTPFEGGLRPGTTLPISLFWEPLVDLAQTNYHVFIHLTTPGDPRPVAQTDGVPMEGGLPTSRWTEPGALLHDDRTIGLPSDLAAGTYVLRMGVYRADDGQRLTATTTAPALDNAVVLGEVTITP
jgi:mannosyltransferase